MQPSEKALIWWINSSWKPKGHFDLHLGSKGFFTISFISLEDRNCIIDRDLYFYYSAGLFLRPSKERFSPENENMWIAPVWIRLYSLPNEYWDAEILEDLGNCVGTFIKIFEQTKAQRYMAYARICLYMDLSKELPKAIKMSWDDKDWVQTLDHEQNSFRCHRCHEYGHMFKECSMNSLKSPPKKEEDNKDQGFTRVPSRKKGGRKQENLEATKKSQYPINLKL